MNGLCAEKSDASARNPTDRDRIRAAFAANPRKKTLQLYRELGICEKQVIRALPAEG